MQQQTVTCQYVNRTMSKRNRLNTPPQYAKKQMPTEEPWHLSDTLSLINKYSRRQYKVSVSYRLLTVPYFKKKNA